MAMLVLKFKLAIEAFHVNWYVLPYLLYVYTFLLETKVKICKMDTAFFIHFKNIQYYFEEFGPKIEVYKLSRCHIWTDFGQNKIKMAVEKISEMYSL